MGPTEAELEEAYRRTAERDTEVSDEWEGSSREANQYLGDAPAIDADAEAEGREGEQQ
jgi:hypothetical protein